MIILNFNLVEAKSEEMRLNFKKVKVKPVICRLVFSSW